MQTATISSIKSELKNLSADELKNICLRLARFSSENKELLSFMLFEAGDESSFINTVKGIMRSEFIIINPNSLRLMRKGISKALKINNKYIKISGSKTTEIELRINFCRLLKDFGLHEETGPFLRNIYERQFIAIQNAIKKLDEDLQFDYGRELETLIIQSRYYANSYVSSRMP
jgi:hypothetical protein